MYSTFVGRVFAVRHVCNVMCMYLRYVRYLFTVHQNCIYRIPSMYLSTSGTYLPYSFTVSPRHVFTVCRASFSLRNVFAVRVTCIYRIAGQWRLHWTGRHEYQISCNHDVRRTPPGECS